MSKLTVSIVHNGERVAQVPSFPAAWEWFDKKRDEMRPQGWADTGAGLYSLTLTRTRNNKTEKLVWTAE